MERFYAWEGLRGTDKSTARPLTLLRSRQAGVSCGIRISPRHLMRNARSASQRSQIHARLVAGGRHGALPHCGHKPRPEAGRVVLSFPHVAQMIRAGLQGFKQLAVGFTPSQRRVKVGT